MVIAVIFGDFCDEYEPILSYLHIGMEKIYNKPICYTIYALELYICVTNYVRWLNQWNAVEEDVQGRCLLG